MKGDDGLEQTNKQLINSKVNIVYITFFLALVLITWLGFLCYPRPNIVELPPSNGVCNLSENNFDGTLYRTNTVWEAWPYQLYTPKDFENDVVTDPPQYLDEEEAMLTSYATYKIRLILPPDTYYGISMVTSEYAMRIYIDGEEIDSVGTPGTTKETTDHRTQERTYYSRTQHSGIVDIIVQTANFVLVRGSGAPQLIIGASSNIMDRNDASLVVNFLISGCLIAAFLYHVGLFCLNRTRRTDLIFAICCLLLAVLNKRLIFIFWPNCPFSVVMLILYTATLLPYPLLISLFECLHPKLMCKYAVQGYYILSGMYLLLLLIDDRIFTELYIGLQVVSVFMMAYLLVRLATLLRNEKLQSYLYFMGSLALSIAAINDMFYYRGIIIIPFVDGQFFMSPIAMIFFVFCYALAVSLDRAETENKIHDTMEKERILAAENAALDRTNELREKLMATISHEARTPLAVLSSYASLVAIELRDKGMDEQTTADLDKISFEAKRVANLIDSMKRMTLSTEKIAERIALDLGDMARQTAQLYMPILERTGVALIIQTEDNLPMVLGNPAELTQVLFNLLQNSKNHTTSGSVTVFAEQDEAFVAICITDTGTGIPTHILPDVFERGIKGDDAGSGIGLAVCKEIIEGHNGTIRIDSEWGKGTKVTIVFPAYKEGNKSE